MIRLKFVLICILSALFLFMNTNIAVAHLYTLKADVNLREGPGYNFRVKQKLKHNQTLVQEEKSGEWIKVKTLYGIEGYIHYEMISNVWIKILKDERMLNVMKGEDVLKSYKIALCPFNPDKDKVKQGDGGTPEGRFYIDEMLKDPKSEKYGARSMRISYPAIEDVRRGLKDKIIGVNPRFSKDITLFYFENY